MSRRNLKDTWREINYCTMERERKRKRDGGKKGGKEGKDGEKD